MRNVTHLQKLAVLIASDLDTVQQSKFLLHRLSVLFDQELVRLEGPHNHLQQLHLVLAHHIYCLDHHLPDDTDEVLGVNFGAVLLHGADVCIHAIVVLELLQQLAFQLRQTVLLDLLRLPLNLQSPEVYLPPTKPQAVTQMQTVERA